MIGKKKLKTKSKWGCFYYRQKKLSCPLIGLHQQIPGKKHLQSNNRQLSSNIGFVWREKRARAIMTSSNGTNSSVVTKHHHLMIKMNRQSRLRPLKTTTNNKLTNIGNKTCVSYLAISWSCIAVLLFCVLTLSPLSVKCASVDTVKNIKQTKVHSQVYLTEPKQQVDKSLSNGESKSLSIPTSHSTEQIEWQPPPCPSPDEVIAPCVCNSTKNEIICRGPTIESDAKLRQSFVVLSKFVPANQLYYSISINLRDLVSLESDIFAGIRFSTVLLRGHNLTYIDKDAFRGTEEHVHTLYIYKTKLTSLQPKYDFFAAVRSLINLKKLTVTSSNLVNIPDRYDS